MGAVKNPAKYEYKLDMDLKDLLLEAGGLSEDIYRYKVEIARLDTINQNQEKFAEIIELDMDDKYSLYDNSNNKLKNFEIQPYDYIIVRPDPYFEMQKIVKVSGSVLYPGTYVIQSDNEKISDMIKRAGGLNKQAFPEGSAFFRSGERVQMNLKKILKRPSHSSNIRIQDGDEIIVSQRLEIIQIRGEVNNPGYYKYQKGKKINDVIQESGGYNNNADVENTFITYPNGQSKKYSRWLKNHKVSDGSIVVVGKKPPEEPFDRTEYLKELTSIIANLAQVISIIVLAR